MEKLMALAMLAAPAGVPEPPEAVRACAGELCAEGVRRGVLDPREVRYMFEPGADPAADLDTLRRRCDELAEAPGLWEGGRFPSREECTAALGLNREFRRWLERRREVEADRARLYEEASREAGRLYEAWDALRDARCDFYYVTVRRQGLARLRALLGEADFAAGRMPPAVPVWRFRAK